MTTAPHGEPEKNGGTFKESYYCSKKGEIDTYIETIMYYNIKTYYGNVHSYYFVAVCLG